MKKTLWLIAAGILAGSTAVHASSLVYGGITAGRSTASGEPSASNIGVLAGVDIPLVPFLSVEANYNRINSWNTKALGLAAVARVSVAPNVHLIGKLGVSHWTVDASGNSTSRNDPMYGLGASYRLSDMFSIRGEYVLVRDHSSSTTVHTTQADLIAHF